MAYVALAELKLLLGIGDTASDIPLQLALDAATAWIDQFTGRSFAAETGATKYFYPTNPNLIQLTPDIRTVTSVAVDNRGDGTFATTLTSGTHFLSMPFQSRPDAGIYSSLHILGNSSLSFGVAQRVRVIGDWGYVVGGQAPASVRQACEIQAARLYKRATEAPFGILQSTDLGTFTRLTAVDQDVKALLTPFKAAALAWIMV